METKSEIVSKLRGVNPDNIIASLLLFLDEKEFPSDPEKLHTGLKKLKDKGEYNDLLKSFVFVDAFPFSYSPLFERILQRLQEAKMLSVRNPDFVLYEISENAKKAITNDILPKFGDEQKAKLKEMALGLKESLT